MKITDFLSQGFIVHLSGPVRFILTKQGVITGASVALMKIAGVIVGVCQLTDVAQDKLSSVKSIPDLNAFVTKYGGDLNAFYLGLEKKLMNNTVELCHSDPVYRAFFKCPQ